MERLSGSHAWGESSKNHPEECRERITRLLEDAEVTKALKARPRVQEQHEEDAAMGDAVTDPSASASGGTVRKADSDRGGGTQTRKPPGL